MKKQLYKILLLSILLSAVGCEKIDIKNNERLLVKGKIVDQNGNPLQNISLKTEALNQILDSSFTNSSGDFKFISLNAKYSPLSILINKNYKLDYENENPDYSGKIYSSEGENENLLIDLGTITLSGLGSFSVILSNQTGDDNYVEYTISYTSKVCNLPLNADDNDTCELDQSISGLLEPTSGENTINGESIVGTTAIFEYQINGESKQTVEIPVTNPPTTYVFEY